MVVTLCVNLSGPSCLDIGSNTILDVYGRVFLDEMNKVGGR